VHDESWAEVQPVGLNKKDEEMRIYLNCAAEFGEVANASPKTKEIKKPTRPQFKR
jgi:hypothetical protein